METISLKTKRSSMHELSFAIGLNSGGLSKLEHSLREIQANASMSKVLFYHIYFCICEACSFLSDPTSSDEKNIKVGILYGSNEIIMDLELLKKRSGLPTYGHIHYAEKARTLDTIRWLCDSYWISDRTDRISIAFKIQS